MKKAIIAAFAGAILVTQPVMADYDNDLWYLSRVIQAESGYCSQQMQEYVGSVVLNRVADDRFPDTIPEVIDQCCGRSTGERKQASGRHYLSGEF